MLRIVGFRAGRGISTALALFASALILMACGSPNAAPGSSAQRSSQSSGTTSSPTAPPVVLAKGASSLCSKVPAAKTGLEVDLNKADWPSATTATGLTPINYNQPGQDGAFIAQTVDGRHGIAVMPGQGPDGKYYSYLELYLTAGGVVPAGTKNVMLCLEYDDSIAGVPLTLQYSGTNTAGPVSGAYDASPDIYVTGGTKQWLVGSFTMTDINFAKGDPGVGKENGNADFRVTSQSQGQATPFTVDRAWLVVSGVPATQSLAAPPSPPTSS